MLFFSALDCARHLAGAQTSGAHIDVLGRTVDNGLDTLDIGLPGAVGASVRVGHFDTKANALAANITLRHTLFPPMLLSIVFSSTSRIARGKEYCIISTRQNQGFFRVLFVFFFFFR